MPIANRMVVAKVNPVMFIQFLIAFIFYHRTETVVKSESDIDVLTTNVNEVGFSMSNAWKYDILGCIIGILDHLSQNVK